MAGTRWYLNNDTAGYTPATLRGGWTGTANGVTKRLSTSKANGSNGLASTNYNWPGAGAFFHFRGVSDALTGAEIPTDGYFSLRVPAVYNNGSDVVKWKIHVYITTGDSDTPRVTLINQRVDASETIPRSSNYSNPPADALEGVDVAYTGATYSAGDRLVVELGFSRSLGYEIAYVGYGTKDGGGTQLADCMEGTAWGSGAAWLQLSDTETPDPNARATQVGIDLASVEPDAIGRVTQVGVDLAYQVPILARVTQIGVDVAWVPKPVVEYVPEGSFGALYWYELESPDGTVQVHAPVPLPDPSDYYHGYKQPKLIGGIRVSRSLSDEKGQFTSQRFSVTSDDSDRYYRTLIQNQGTRVLLNRRITARLIGVDEWRARGLPRTVAIGLVRNYNTK